MQNEVLNEGLALKSLDKAAELLTARKRGKALSTTEFCKTYRKIEPLLPMVIGFVKLIPVYGAKIAVVLEFLSEAAGQLCPIAKS